MKNVPIAIYMYESCTYEKHSWGFLIFICQDRYMTVSVAFRAICMHEKPRTCFPVRDRGSKFASWARILSPYPFVCPCLHLSYYPSCANELLNNS